jgi:hypothetical protein
MITAQLRSLHSADFDVPDTDLAKFDPDDREYFRVYIEAAIGPRGDDGAEVFGFDTCSPRWLLANPPQKGFAFGRWLLLPRWNYDIVVRSISDLCDRTSGQDWNEVAVKLSRMAYWEFEDYSE